MPRLDDIRAFFDRMAPSWDQNNEHDETIISALLTLASCPTGACILDVACGTGVLLPFLLAMEPRQVDAIDLSPEMAAIAAEKWNAPRVHVECADFYSYERGPFDLITVYSAYPHFFDKDAFALRAAKLLAPGGRLLIAHAQSREAINSRHGDGAVSVSTLLRTPEEEGVPLNPYFKLDAMVDTERLYLLSGTRRKEVTV